MFYFIDLNAYKCVTNIFTHIPYAQHHLQLNKYDILVKNQRNCDIFWICMTRHSTHLYETRNSEKSTTKKFHLVEMLGVCLLKLKQCTTVSICYACKRKKKKRFNIHSRAISKYLTLRYYDTVKNNKMSDDFILCVDIVPYISKHRYWTRTLHNDRSYYKVSEYK